MIEWLALRRVHEGGVTKLGGGYLHYGQPLADYLGAALDELLRTEHLALGRPTPSRQQQVCVTHAGQVRYAELRAAGEMDVRDGD
ncbi:MAG: hypothetical protein ABR608_04410 [Pseudonocardiaceae bacterium]